LSRACLGKMIVFQYINGSKKPFLHVYIQNGIAKDAFA